MFRKIWDKKLKKWVDLIKLLYIRCPIILVIIFFMIIGLLALGGLFWAIDSGWLGEFDSKEKGRTAVTLGTALTGISYVVLKYRERVSAERAEMLENSSRADKNLFEAAERLSSDKAIVQISGVYALSAVADEFKDYNQRVVDILCAYIRAPRKRDFSVVESTIMGEISRHLESASGNRVVVNSWSRCNFDFHNAVFDDDLELNDSVIYGAWNFSGATFNQKLKINGTCFQRTSVSFEDCLFEDSVSLVNVDSTLGELNFSKSYFIGVLSIEDDISDIMEGESKHHVLFDKSVLWVRFPGSKPLIMSSDNCISTKEDDALSRTDCDGNYEPSIYLCEKYLIHGHPGNYSEGDFIFTVPEGARVKFIDEFHDELEARRAGAKRSQEP